MIRSERVELLAPVIALARRAGRVILEHYRGDFGVQRKADATPVTDADEASELLILDGLRKLTPHVPAVSEEAAARDEIDLTVTPPRVFWLVDPLDGTREFVKRNGEFCICIGLVEDGEATLGVLHAPVSGAVYAAAERDGAFAEDANGTRRPIHVRALPPGGVTVLESRSHGDKDAQDAYLSDYAVAERLRRGSAIKFGLVAEGVADINIRLGRTMEWDTAAGQAILEAAGGNVRTLAGERLRYGKRGFDNPDFIAAGV